MTDTLDSRFGGDAAREASALSAGVAASADAPSRAVSDAVSGASDTNSPTITPATGAAGFAQRAAAPFPDLLAERMAALHAVTGWPVKAYRARDGYVFIASQFIANKRMRAFVFERVPDSELCNGVQGSSAFDPRPKIGRVSEDRDRVA